ncbi:TetR family transcriptional regulator [Labrys okinawensis]|uniref:TetR family transcriptional regulator n=1 Tax=Labrys okinawensis TaxID=346911 RepID=A0A2S9Q572_9HYPH|nr:TetR/AcrR family transcriptional regulator [Labrys okinawensis]PRH84470.1 TetR family transcriptional regulator [Labrys okinawensis]
MQEGGRRTNPDRTLRTRTALIAAARRLFVAKGYADTGTPELVAEAGVTRGALYHHFADKQALFRAVVETENAALADEIERAAPAELGAMEALIAGGEAFLAAMSEPGRTRLLLIEAPAVLGRETMDAIDASHGGRTLREGIAAAVADGALRPVPVDEAALLLSAVYDRAALSIAAGADGEEWRALIRAVLDGLRPAAG